jgi:transcriptional regulator with XRE-family HTH domain
MKKNLQTRITNKIKEKLTKEGKSPEKLAFEIGMSKSYLYAFLGGRKDIILKNLERIADGLEVDVKELL